MKRVFLIVLDSFGIGAMPDSAVYGDIGVNTLASVSKSPEFKADNLKKWCEIIQVEMKMAMVQLPCWAERRTDGN